MKNSVLMRSINTLYFTQNNSLILKLTSGQRKKTFCNTHGFTVRELARSAMKGVSATKCLINDISYIIFSILRPKGRSFKIWGILWWLVQR
jgi:hypothetical protein